MRDFAWWSGLTAADARRGIQIADKALERRTFHDASWWLWADAPAVPRARSAHLLPNYDEYFIGFRDRSAGAQRLGSAALITGGSMLITHVIVVDGQLVGGWKRLTRDDGVRVEASWLVTVSPAERRLIGRQVKRLEHHIGAPVSLYSSG